MGLAVANHTLRFDLPQRGFAWRLGAGKACGIDGIVEYHHVAALPLGAFRCKARIIGRLYTQGIQETLTEIVGNIQLFGIDARSARLDEFDIAGRHDASALLVIFDPLRDHAVTIVINLHTAAGGDALSILIIGELVGTQKHLRVVRLDRHETLRMHDIRREATYERRHTCQQSGGKPSYISAVTDRH
ncbi:hypothetical protein D3C73_924040 [compost metagenome]